MSERTAQFDGSAVTIWSALSDTNVPVVGDIVDNTDGVDITGYPAPRPRVCVISIELSDASGVIQGPIYVAGYDATLGQWVILGSFNGDADVGAGATVGSATVGWAERFEDVGLYSRVAMFAAANTTTAGTVTATLQWVKEVDH